MHKMVNGLRVELSKEEEESIKAEWEANSLKKEQKKRELQELKAEKERVVDKLLSGLTEDEKALIRGKLL